MALYARSADPGAPLLNSISSFHQDVWKTEQGLPHNTVPAIVQSSDGYLWSGSELGLVRFDGLRFAVFDKSNTPELKSNLVDALLQDREGALWIGTLGGGLTRLRNGQFHTFTANDGLASDSVRCLFEDRAGDLWIGSDGKGVSRFHQGRFTTFTVQNGLADNEVFALAQDRDGAIWIGTHDGLSRFSNGVFRNFKAAEGLPHLYIRTLCMTSQNVLWIGTSGGGLIRLQDGVFRSFTTRDGLPANSIAAVREDSAGNLWIGTIGGGLCRMSGQTFSSYSSKNGLPSNDVWSIYQDIDKSIWLGTGGGGLVRLVENNVFTAYSTKDGLSNQVTLPVFEDHQGTLWIGTNGGGLNRLRDGRFSALTTKDGLADNLVLTISEDHDGALWIGTRKGLNRLVNGKLTTFTKDSGLPANAIITSYVDHSGTLWIGTRAGLSVWSDRAFKTYTTKNGLSSNVVQAIYEDRQHHLWIGTAGGLDLFRNGRFEIFDSRRGLSNNLVVSLYEDAAGVLWIGTNGGGLNRLEAGRITAYTTKDGLLDDAVFRILEDNSGNLWLSGNKGVFRVSRRVLNEFAQKKTDRITVVPYGTADGMNTRECNGGFQPAGWKTHDGRLWFPTMQGVVVVDPQKLKSGGAPQPVVIEQVFIDRHKIDTSRNVQMPPGAGGLEFHYSAPNLLSAGKIVFRYRLEGFDSSWIDAGGRRTAYYTNIPPGRYRFEVMATNRDGTWSPVIGSIAFSLKAHFYQTAWFLSLCVLGVIGLIVAGDTLHVRQLRKREKILAGRVAERTAALRDEVAERQRAELESLEAKESAERASRVKSEFLANMSHEIRTPMNAILGMTELALTTKVTSEQRQFLEVIQNSADSLLTVINDILDVSKIEAGKLQLDPIPINLREVLERAVKTMGFRAHQKGLTLTSQVDPNVPQVVNADPVRLSQILLNLLSNAIKFTDKGEVLVRLGCDGKDRRDCSLHFLVRDSGIGIPRENLASIFAAFEQGDSSTTRKFGGTGLGLTICHNLAHLMGGTIWAESELNKGSEFHFTVKFGMPTVQAPAAAPAQTLAWDTDSVHRLAGVEGPLWTVLLAEDNPANRMVARLTLERGGFLVREVKDGRDAVEAALKTRFDLIVMDCRMPVFDGYAATRQIRESPGPNRQTPIIALTAAAYAEDRERSQQAGMNDFVAKPFQGMDLVTKCIGWVKSNASAANGLAALDAAVKKEPAGQREALSGVSPNLIKDLMGIFLETAPPVFDKLLDALGRKDWASAREAAHWLRGGATRLADPDLPRWFEKIEAACANDPQSIAAAELEDLEASFKAACRIAQTLTVERAV